MTAHIVGWISSICFSLCGLPQAYECYKKKHANGINTSFLVLWSIGIAFAIVYNRMTSKDEILLTNYLSNAVFLLIIFYYKIKPYEKT